jgi:Rod binding domain-containing protein
MSRPISPVASAAWFPAGTLPSAPPAKPGNIAEAAKQFEALLIAQMLRTARESSSGSLDGESSSADTMFDVAGQQFAKVLADNGGLGLAKMIVQSLKGK